MASARHGYRANAHDKARSGTSDDETKLIDELGHNPSSSDEPGSDNDAAYSGRLDAIDRIMKSFCASLDSKLAAAGAPTVKKEAEPPEPISLDKSRIVTIRPAQEPRASSPRKRAPRSLKSPASPAPPINRQPDTSASPVGGSTSTVRTRGAHISSAPRPQVMVQGQVEGQRPATRVSPAAPLAFAQPQQSLGPPPPPAAPAGDLDPALGPTVAAPGGSVSRPWEHIDRLRRTISASRSARTAARRRSRTNGPEAAHGEEDRSSTVPARGEPGLLDVSGLAGDVAQETTPGQASQATTTSSNELSATMSTVSSSLPDISQQLFGMGGEASLFLHMTAMPSPSPEVSHHSQYHALTTPPEEETLEGEIVPATNSPEHREKPRKTLESDAKAAADGDGDGRRKRPKRAPLESPVDREKGGKKFACPYYKRNPKKYRNWTSCPGPGWDEVHRVKTHLYRRHPLPIQCPRCWAVFKADGQLQSHLQQDPACTIQGNRMPHEGFTKDQEKRLRSRKKAHANMTDEDKWREIYAILFPDDDQSAVPSPYYDSDNDNEGGEHADGTELEDYATFVRREMPTLVRRELEVLFEGEFRDIEERLRPRIADIVLNLQPRLLSLYKQSQLPLSEYGPQDTDGSGTVPTPTVSHGKDTVTRADGGTPAAAPSDGFFYGDLSGVNGDMGENWIGGHTPQLQLPETGGLGLNWDFEFDRLLNPMMFMPPGMESG